MPFTVEVWCPDCTNEDYQGCFDGGAEFLEDDDCRVEEFATREEAEAAGRVRVRDTIYHFDIHEVAPQAPSETPTPESK